jgi:hypothetical protein
MSGNCWSQYFVVLPDEEKISTRFLDKKLMEKRGYM